MKGTKELAEIVEEVAAAAQHAAPVMRVLVVEQEVGRRPVVEAFGDFLVEERTGVGPALLLLFLLLLLLLLLYVDDDEMGL